MKYPSPTLSVLLPIAINLMSISIELIGYMCCFKSQVIDSQSLTCLQRITFDIIAITVAKAIFQCFQRNGVKKP